MKLLKSVAVYGIGLLFTALGGICAVRSNLGVSPINSLPYTLSVISGIELGTMTTLIYVLFLLTQIVLLRKKFNPKNLLQIVVSSAFGSFVDLFDRLLAFENPQSIPARGLLMVASMVCISIGVFLIVRANIVPLPSEGLLLVISQLTSCPFHKVKIVFDSSAVVLSAVLSLLFLHKIVGIGIGTIAAALCIGRMIGLYEKILARTTAQCS